VYKTIINNFAASALLAKQHEHEAKKRRKKHKKKDFKQPEDMLGEDLLPLSASQLAPWGCYF